MLKFMTNIKSQIFVQRSEGFKPLRYKDGSYIFSEIERDRAGKLPRSDEELQEEKSNRKKRNDELLPDAMKGLFLIVMLTAGVVATSLSLKLAFILWFIGVVFFSPWVAVIIAMVGIWLSI
jgi:hypothetical protein